MPTSGTADKLTVEDKLRAERFERLAGDGASAVPEMLEGLTDRSWAVRRKVVAALAALGEPAVAPLCRLLAEQRDNEARLAAIVDALAASTGNVEPRARALTEHPDPAVIVDAAQILGRRRSAEAVPVLAKLTTHPDDNVSVAALEALGRIGGRSAVDVLVGAVQSGNFFRTFPAIDVLGRSGDPRAVPALATLLDVPTYALEAARALGKTGDKAATAPLASLLARQSDAMARVAATALLELERGYALRYGAPGVVELALKGAAPLTASRRLAHAIVGASNAEQEAICWTLGALGDHAAVQVLTNLLDGPPPVSAAAIAALKKLQRDSEGELLDALKAGDSARRLALLPMLGAEYAAAPELTVCLLDPDPMVRSLTCETLARTGNPVVVRKLFEVLADNNPAVVHAATAAIQSLGSAETEMLALAAARSEDERVQRAALRIIGYFGYGSALEPLLELIQHGNSRVRDGAIEALPFIEDPRALATLLSTLRHADPKARATAARALGHCERDPQVTTNLLHALDDAEPWVRYYACRSLGRLGWEPAVDPVIGLLSDPAGQVRVSAVEALSHLHSPAAFEALQRLSQADDADLRRAAVVGLGIGKWEHAVQALVGAARSTDPATRLVAVSAIAEFAAPEALITLGRAARDPDEAVRSAAIGFLASRPSRDATKLLIELATEDPHNPQVLAGLALAAEGRITGLVEALQQADDELAARLVSALTRMRSAAAVEALLVVAGSRNPAARRAVAPALAAVGTTEAIAALRRLSSSDDDAEVRRVSALALSQ